LPSVATQDFFIENKFLAQRGFNMRPLQPNRTGLMAASSQALQIMPSDNHRMCMDVKGGDGKNGDRIQIWGCNGMESQLWYFDPGSFQITWAGDRNKCVDAHPADKEGRRRIQLWDCGHDGNGNVWPQQNWGYDSDAGTIYLASSGADASSCLGVYGGFTQDFAEMMYLQDCDNSQRGQIFYLQNGITVRSVQQFELCLDVPGGDLTNGNQLQMWPCNGLATQYWVFETGSNRIKAASDLNKCVDAGDLSSSSRLMIWDCNDHETQDFGYDVDAKCLYLSSSGDASLCVDLAGASLTGAKVQVWECNQCWNQQIQAYGPVSLSSAKLDFTLESAVRDCPPAPSSISSDNVFPEDHCAYDSSHGDVVWPRFDTEQDLKNDAYWSVYFEAVYGGVPSSGYPICTGAFQFLWKIAAQNAGVVNEPTQCVGDNHPDGQKLPSGYYFVGSGTAEATSVFSYIYNPNYDGVAVPSAYWVEVTHTVFGGDAGATWFYMSVGSGVWYNVGATIVFHDHNAAAFQFLGENCADDKNDDAGGAASECEGNFPQLYPAVRSLGYNSIQFTHHFDCTCGRTGHSTFPHHFRLCPTEIVDVDDQDGATKACVGSFKGGWEASAGCACDESFSSDTHTQGQSVGYSNCGAS
jgi:hypothetical protein